MSSSNGQDNRPVVFRLWFKQQLASRGWDGKTAAGKIGVQPGTISKWLRRKTPPEMKGLVAIGRAFGIPTEDVIVAAGYPVTASETDADRENRRLALLAAMPRFAEIIDRVARMPPDRQDAYLSVIEAMLPPDDDANQSSPQ
jgi:transcriptional regulator with XRE-family HTH domain